MTKSLMVGVLVAVLAAAGAADAKSHKGGGEKGRGWGLGKPGQCTFQSCFDKCLARGSPTGSSLTNRHCGNICRRRCT